MTANYGDPVVTRDGPGYRDTAAGLGRLIPRPEPDCRNPTCRERHRMLHLLADQAEHTRDHVQRLTADLASAERTARELRARYQGGTP